MELDPTKITLLSVVLALVIVIAIVISAKAKSGSSDTSANKKNDPLGEVHLLLAYNRKKEAIAVLEKHLQSNPSDHKALELLDSIRKL